MALRTKGNEGAYSVAKAPVRGPALGGVGNLDRSSHVHWMHLPHSLSTSTVLHCLRNNTSYTGNEVYTSKNHHDL